MNFASARWVRSYESIRLMPREVQQDVMCVIAGPFPLAGKRRWQVTEVHPNCPVHGEPVAGLGVAS